MERAKFKSKVLCGPFGVQTKIHRPFQPDRAVYDNSQLPDVGKSSALGDKNGSNKGGKKDKRVSSLRDLSGTRFGKTSISNNPWRPNNPSKKGYNAPLNNIKYYHTGLYYKEKPLDRRFEEKIWM